MTNWNDLPAQLLPVDRLTWPCHDIDPNHLHPEDSRPLTQGPIHVEALLDGHYFIHDGRHRTIRAIHAGHTHIWARIA